MINRNKQGLRLDLKQALGVEVFLRLATTADVIVESFRPGVMDKLGIGYAAVAAVNPKVAYCSISGYGQDGPYRDLAGHDINYLGYAGVVELVMSFENDFDITIPDEDSNEITTVQSAIDYVTKKLG